MNKDSINYFTVSTITKRVRDILAPAMQKQFWVKAELSSTRERGGHFYCNLVETGDGGKIAAQISCSIWQHNFQKIKTKFKAHQLHNAFQDGTLVGLLCQLRFHDQFGLSLEAIDADPAVALGELELKKQKLISELLNLGLDKPNKAKLVPQLPFRIGLITAHNSAAYSDFCETLLKSRFGFQIIFADAIMQGQNTENSVLKAMLALNKITPDLDLVILCRGGGSRIDLSALDSERIAKMIAGYHYPVWTGIGHEIDTSVLDHISNTAFKTPTAIAESIIARYVEVEKYLEGAQNFLKSSWPVHVDQEKQWQTDRCLMLERNTRQYIEKIIYKLQHQGLELSHKITGRITDERGYLKESRIHLTAASKSVIQSSFLEIKNYRERLQVNRFLKVISGESEKLIGKGRVLHSADPATIVDRGFAIVYDEQGRVISSAKGLLAGSVLKTRLKDGEISSEVI